MTIDQKLKYVAEVAPKQLPRFQRCFDGSAGPLDRIVTFCTECMGFSADDARTCTTMTCPLHGGRPEGWTGGRKRREGRKMTPEQCAQARIKLAQIRPKRPKSSTEEEF